MLRGIKAMQRSFSKLLSNFIFRVNKRNKNLNALIEFEVRTHAVLLLTLTVTMTFDLSTQNHVTLGYPKVIPYTKFELFGIIRFLSYAPDISVYLLTLRSLPLTTEPKTIPLLQYPMFIPFTKFEHFGIIRF